MKDKYTPGQDCGCYAYSESECGCGADWTPSEVYELRDQLAADHAAALARIDELFTAKPGTPEGDELDLLVTLVELYEEKQFPIALPSPVEAIRFRMEGGQQ